MATSNADTARELRAIAEWMDEHPFEQVNYVFVDIAAADRADLERIAGAFGPEAKEDRSAWSHDPEVNITRKFGESRVKASVKLSKLVPPMPEPEVAPIIPVPEVCEVLDTVCQCGADGWYGYVGENGQRYSKCGSCGEILRALEGSDAR